MLRGEPEVGVSYYNMSMHYIHGHDILCEDIKTRKHIVKGSTIGF